jgi:hypothetical protein
MADILIPRAHLPPVVYEDIVRNGKLVEWRAGARVASAMVQAIVNYRKAIAWKVGRASSPAQGAGGSTVPYRWYFYTGESPRGDDTVNFRVKILLAPANNTSATDPRCRVVCGAVTSGYVRHPDEVTGALRWNDIREFTVDLTLDANTAYECRIEAEDFCRIVGFSAYEYFVVSKLESGATYFVSRGNYRYREPILDGQHEDIHPNMHVLWKHNAAQLQCLMPDTISDQWQRTTASYANMIRQAASTTVGADTPGQRLQAQYHQPLHSDDVECFAAVYGTCASSAGGAVKLVDDNGTALVTLSSFSTSGEWKTGTFVLPGNVDLQKCDWQFQGGGGAQELTIESACAGEHVT